MKILYNCRCYISLLTLMLALIACNFGAQASITPTPAIPALQVPTSTPTQLPTTAFSKSWVAYASGLASTFTKGDICSLEQPFVLEGDYYPVSTNLVANFAPTDPTRGNYTYTNVILGEDCFESSTGTYVVLFYTATEGDIVMTGTVTRECLGIIVFNQITEAFVAIRERPGSICP